MEWHSPVFSKTVEFFFSQTGLKACYREQWYLLTVVVEESQRLVVKETFLHYLNLRHPKVASTNTPNVQRDPKNALIFRSDKRYTYK